MGEEYDGNLKREMEEERKKVKERKSRGRAFMLDDERGEKWMRVINEDKNLLWKRNKMERS